MPDELLCIYCNCNTFIIISELTCICINCHKENKIKDMQIKHNKSQEAMAKEDIEIWAYNQRFG
jgi:hypothetical protein